MQPRPKRSEPLNPKEWPSAHLLDTAFAPQDLTHTQVESDHELFRQATKDVQPLPGPYYSYKPSCKRDRMSTEYLRLRATQDVHEPLRLSDMQAQLSPISGETPILYVRNALPQQRIKKLRLGLPLSNRPAGPELDLHGMSIDQARTALQKWICYLYHNQHTQALLISGKGKPGHIAPLKTHVVAWLKQLEEVLAFCTAQSRDGGSGAFYVLLANKKL